MGGFTSKNLPRPEFCGGWADGKGTYMTISPTGAIKYVKSVGALFESFFNLS